MAQRAQQMASSLSKTVHLREQTFIDMSKNFEALYKIYVCDLI